MTSKLKLIDLTRDEGVDFWGTCKAKDFSNGEFKASLQRLKNCEEVLFK